MLGKKQEQILDLKRRLFEKIVAQEDDKRKKRQKHSEENEESIK